MEKNKNTETGNEKVRPRMPIEQRAKQFMPFAAVTGLEEALREKEREVQADYGIINRNVHNEKFTDE